MGKQIHYDKEHDILAIHKGFSNGEKFKGNIDIDDLILDISTKDKVKGIEILNATEFLKEFEINKDILENITDAELNVTINPQSITIGLVIKSKNIEHKIPAKIAVPLSISA